MKQRMPANAVYVIALCVVSATSENAALAGSAKPADLLLNLLDGIEEELEDELQALFYGRGRANQTTNKDLFYTHYDEVSSKDKVQVRIRGDEMPDITYAVTVVDYSVGCGGDDTGNKEIDEILKSLTRTAKDYIADYSEEYAANYDSAYDYDYEYDYDGSEYRHIMLFDAKQHSVQRSTSASRSCNVESLEQILKPSKESPRVGDQVQSGRFETEVN